MSGTEPQGESCLSAAEALYKENLATVRWIQERTLTVVLQAVAFDVLIASAAVTTSIRLAIWGKVVAGTTLAALHLVVFGWLADQKQGLEKRVTHMREAHAHLRQAIGRRDGPPNQDGKGRPKDATWTLLRTLLAIAGLAALLAVTWPALLTT